MTSPTDAQKREAVERWARARLSTGGHPRGSWRFECDGGSVIVTKVGVQSFRVDPDTALLACLLIDAGLTVDVGRCPECEARGWTFTAGHIRRREQLSPLDTLPTTDAGGPWRRFRFSTLGLMRWVDVCFRARRCSDCNATGRQTIEAARLVLDAAPGRLLAAVDRRDSFDEAVAVSEERDEAREALTVLADDRQQAGDQIGEWLALWLGGHDGWQGAAMRPLDAVFRAYANIHLADDVEPDLARQGGRATCARVR